MRLYDFDPTKLPSPLKKVGEKELHLWLGAWLKYDAERRLRGAHQGLRHVLFAICDHYEPLHGNVDMARGIERVKRWRETYPKIAAKFRDGNGRAPRHSYFYPGEQYDPRLVEPIAELVAQGLGEVEVHLHHDGDTRATLQASLDETLNNLNKHGLVPQKNGKHAWAFIHGNWCLGNARRDGKWCGVDDEMDLLYEMGCYADLTFPSAPDESQPGVVNRIYYPMGDMKQRRAYEDAEIASVGTPKRDRLLLIEGPLALSFRPNSFRVRIESSALDHTDPPTAERLATWVQQGIGIGGRPEWTFVKVHTHGAPEKNADVMLGDSIERFHHALQAYNDGVQYQLHYVSAREMYNVARAGMEGHAGDPSAYFDYEIPPAARLR